MPDLLLFILAPIIFIAGFMSFADKDLKKFAPYIIMVGVLLGIWIGIVLNKDFEIISKKTIPITQIEDTNGNVMQIANYKNEIINITQRFKKYYPNNKYRLKIIKHNIWMCGVLRHFSNEYSYEIIDEQGKTVD